MGLRVLIVDDKTAVRKMLKLASQKREHEALNASHATDAMNLLAIEDVDAVLSDVPVERSKWP